MAESVPKIWVRDAGESFHRVFQTEIEDFFAVRYGRETVLPFRLYVAWPILLALAVALVYAYPDYRSGNWLRLGLFVLGAVAAGLLVAWLTRDFASGFVRGFWIGAAQKQGALGRSIDMTLDRSGLAVMVDGQSFFSPWEALFTIEENDNRYVFWIDGRHAYVLPKRLFGQDELATLSESIALWWGGKPGDPARRGQYMPGSQGQDRGVL